MTVVDIHNHFFPDALPDLQAKFGGPPAPRVVKTGPANAEVMIGDKLFRKLDSNCWDVERRLAEMDRDGVDIQIISATPVLFSYGRPANEALYMAQTMNDYALAMCAKGKGRLHALCQVPLQDIDASCTELDRAMKAGHKGVQIGNHVGPKNLDDDGIVTFLQHCADRGAAVLVHPWDMMAPERMPNYMMPWTVSMPAETQLSIVAMILGGAFDRLPKSLKIVFGHGGGSFAFLLGRLEAAWKNIPSTRGKSTQPPSLYCDRFCVDALVFDARAFKLLVEVMGEDRVMLASDYPYPLGDHKIDRLVRSAGYLSPSAQSKMLCDTAIAFHNIAPAAS